MSKIHIEVIDRAYAAVLTAKTPAQRAWMVNDCHRTARVFLAAGERARHPDWPEERIQLAVSKRLIDGAD